ncbi:MAG: class I SAM-dependent methyltransferase [Candidatus Shapirobacteria bacterium]|jgi:ubiquinone/menaquinone biosynthesis C-methylase UbiE
MKNYDWFHLMETYKNIVRPNFIVLEIGASTIDRTNEIAKYCQKLIGVEYLNERLLKNHNNIHYQLGDWQKLTKVIPQNSIDLAISSHTIEHIPNDIKALNKLYSVLKPNSYAILNTPNRKRLVRQIIELFTNERQFPYWEHIREYTEDDLIKLIKKTKFKEYKITPVCFGIHGGNIKFYLKKVPKHFRKFSNFWEIVLKK